MARSKSYDKILKYFVTATCTEPLHVGSASGDKEEVLVHPVDDVPFIQASSIAGVFRGYYERTFGEQKAAELFGCRRFSEKKDDEDRDETEHGSKIRFSDGVFKAEDLILELRPRVSIDRGTGTCEESTDEKTQRTSGHKFNMEYISAGAEFKFYIYLYGADAQEKRGIEDIFSAINHHMIQFGGQKSNGCGYFEIKRLLFKEFNMEDKADRNLWAQEDEMSDSKYKDMTNELARESWLKNVYDIEVYAKTEGALLVKSLAVPGVGEGVPDSENIKNGKGDYIVPGSSFKGAVHAQMERIAKYLNCEKVIDDAFGKESNKTTQGNTGNLYFFDVVVGDQEKNKNMPLSHRIHIDKFTGGVIHGGLFAERNVAGDMKIKISVKNNKDESVSDKVCGLLIMALRDLAVGAMSIGSGYSIGKGIITVKKIVINKNLDSKKKAEINFSQNKISDENGIIKECLTSLQKG